MSSTPSTSSGMATTISRRCSIVFHGGGGAASVGTSPTRRSRRRETASTVGCPSGPAAARNSVSLTPWSKTMVHRSVDSTAPWVARAMSCRHESNWACASVPKPAPR